MQRSGSASCGNMPECPYGSPQIKHSGINIRCNKVEPDRQPAAKTKTGHSGEVACFKSGQRAWIVAIAAASER
jgi:hypothetical protein